MQLAQTIRILRKEGFLATRGRIRSAIRGGYIRPMPEKAGRGAYDFTTQHLKQIRWYLVHVRPGPQPVHIVEFHLRGQSDRIHRLEQKRERNQEKMAAKTQETEFWAAIDMLESLVKSL